VLFNSFPFIFGFLPISLIATYAFGRKQALAKLILAVLSLIFYAWWRLEYLPLLLFSIAFNYIIGDRIQRAVAAERERQAKILLTVGVLIDVAMLGWFKYANFLVDNIDAVSGLSWHLEHIILPLAISFYTFQKIAYLVDSARGEAHRLSPLDFALFASFFPQLIAGPIVHFKEVIPQFQSRLFGRLIWRNVLVGLTIMSIGLFKKTVIADTLSGYNDPMFALADRGGSFDVISGWVAAISYTFQLYFDFSGYSDMAIGLARMFGVKLPLNFHSPLRAPNIVEYWRRWHMTLQRMIYGYVFQPLSLFLNRQAMGIGLEGWSAFLLGVGLPAFLTFVIVGIWHGAGWTFVLFGVMHAIYVTAFEIWRERRARLNRKLRRAGRQIVEPSVAERAAGHLATLVAILFANVVFRSRSVASALSIWLGMVGHGGLNTRAVPGWDLVAALAICVGIVALFPNTQQIMGRFEPAYNWREWRSVAEPAIAWTWRPSTIGLLLAGGTLFLGIMFIQRGQAIFLYFNF
jgi:alginate O-acetyltransferase complex protein AlgI